MYTGNNYCFLLDLSSCSSCVGSLNCDWCPVEFGCRTRGGNCSASAVVSGTSPSSKRTYCSLHTYAFTLCNSVAIDILYVIYLVDTCVQMLVSFRLSPQSTSGSCPRVLPSSTTDGRYYLHEGLSSPDVSLVLNAQNLISPVSCGSR